MATHPIYPRFLAHLSGDAAQPVTVQLLDPHSRRILHYLTLPEARGLLDELTRAVAAADRRSAVGDHHAPGRAERPPASATASAMGPAKAAASGDLFRRRRG